MVWDGKERRVAPDLDIGTGGKYDGVCEVYASGDGMVSGPMFTDSVRELAEQSGGRLKIGDHQYSDGMSSALCHTPRVNAVERRKIQV